MKVIIPLKYHANNVCNNVLFLKAHKEEWVLLFFNATQNLTWLIRDEMFIRGWAPVHVHMLG